MSYGDELGGISIAEINPKIFKRAVLQLLEDSGDISDDVMEKVERALDEGTTAHLMEWVKTKAPAVEFKINDPEVAIEFLSGKTSIKGDIFQEVVHQYSNHDSYYKSQDIYISVKEYHNTLEKCLSEIEKSTEIDTKEIDQIRNNYKKETNIKKLRHMTGRLYKWMKENATKLTDTAIILMGQLHKYT